MMKEDALKEPRRVSGGGRDIRSNYLFCPMFCRSCTYFTEAESNWPYLCSQGTSDNIAKRSEGEGYKQYDECKYYQEKERETIRTTIPFEKPSSQIGDEKAPMKRSWYEAQQEERRRQKEEMEREREEAERQYEAEQEYNETHCFSCGEKGMLVEFYGKYFHDKCLEIFKNSENGKNWIHEKETEKERNRIADENSSKIYNVVGKYGDNLWKNEYIYLYKEFCGKEFKYADYVNLFQRIDIDNFTLFMENKFKEKKADEKARKEQAETERQRKEAEEQAKREAEKKAKETKERDRYLKKIKISVFIIGILALFGFGNFSVIDSWLPIAAITGIVAFYYKMLSGFLDSGYDTIDEYAQKGESLPKVYKFIVYAGIALVSSAIYGGLIFLVMRVLLKIW
jgi:hypothetical protein